MLISTRVQERCSLRGLSKTQVSCEIYKRPSQISVSKGSQLKKRKEIPQDSHKTKSAIDNDVLLWSKKTPGTDKKPTKVTNALYKCLCIHGSRKLL
jgi:hypothetical protein